MTQREKAVIDHLVVGRNISRNTNLEFDDTITFGQRLADRVASFGGSWVFIIFFFRCS